MSMRAVLAAVVCACGCGKQLNAEFCAAHPADERCLAGGLDAPSSGFDIAHLDAATEAMLTSSAALSIGVPTMIDTTSGTVTPSLPTGAVVLASVVQQSGSPVMVIQAASISLTSDVTIIGNKPLVLVATGAIVVGGRIDASAVLERPGPGGSGPMLGDGAGLPGSGGGTAADGGGGGGSFGTSGGRGGSVSGGFAGGEPGALYGSALDLVGGSGGGTPSRPGGCMVLGGGGGGAIQLSAVTSITIDMGIHAGGGGGEGGPGCSSNGSGGAGGGSGGMIFLQAPTLLGSGTLAANGGGGGEAASDGGGTPGANGMDATVTGGGLGGDGDAGGVGGNGAQDTTPGGQGGDVGSDSNGGGGGGGGGRVYYQTTGPAPAYTASPPATDA